ncbi:MAG: hypothetical protein Q7T71_09880 [Herbiconiux sp.]|nr:hypothetical protein [Herbiconiux sp.]
MTEAEDRRDALARALRRNRSRQEQPALLRSLSARLHQQIGPDALLALDETDVLAAIAQRHHADPRQARDASEPELLAVVTTSESVALAFIERALLELAGSPLAVLTVETPTVGAPLLKQTPKPADVLRFTRPEDTITLCTPRGESGLLVDRDTFSDHRPPMFALISWTAPELGSAPMPRPNLTAEEAATGTSAFAAWRREF